MVSCDVQHEIDETGSRTLIAPRPLVQAVAPKRPKLRGVGSDLEPVVADEEEIVGPLPQSTKAPFSEDVPTKDVTEDLRRNKDRYVQ